MPKHTPIIDRLNREEFTLDQLDEIAAAVEQKRRSYGVGSDQRDDIIKAQAAEIAKLKRDVERRDIHFRATQSGAATLDAEIERLQTERDELAAKLAALEKVLMQFMNRYGQLEAVIEPERTQRIIQASLDAGTMQAGNTMRIPGDTSSRLHVAVMVAARHFESGKGLTVVNNGQFHGTLDEFAKHAEQYIKSICWRVPTINDLKSPDLTKNYDGVSIEAQLQAVQDMVLHVYDKTLHGDEYKARLDSVFDRFIAPQLKIKADRADARRDFGLLVKRTYESLSDDIEMPALAPGRGRKTDFEL